MFDCVRRKLRKASEGGGGGGRCEIHHPYLDRPRATNHALFNEIDPGHNEGPIP